MPSSRDTRTYRKVLADIPRVETALLKEFDLGWSESGAAVGEKAANAILPEARASLDFRLVADQKPERVRDLVEAHFIKLGWTVVHEAPDTERKLQMPRPHFFQWELGYPAYRAPLDASFSRTLVEAIQPATGGQPVIMPILGRSIPMELFDRVLGLPIALFPIANHDNNQHAPNENLRFGKKVLNPTRIL